MDRVGIGFIGCGNISAAYLKAARDFPVLDVRAVADIAPQAAAARGEEFGVPAKSIDDLLGDPAIEIVVNLTVPLAHVEVGLRAIAAGKHVHSEKPLAVTVAEARRLLDAARDRGVRVGCAPDTFLGAGHQAAFQLRAALEQRAFEKVIGWNLHPEMLPNLQKVADEAGVPFEAVELGGMRKADVIISITSSFEATLGADQVAPGTHVACMGTDTKGKQEVAPELLARAVVFTDEVAQSVSIGEAQHAVAQGLIGEGDVQQLGAVINGAHPGRRNAEEITLFDGTGVGLQDLAVASRVVELAQAQGRAMVVDF